MVSLLSTSRVMVLPVRVFTKICISIQFRSSSDSSSDRRSNKRETSSWGPWSKNKKVVASAQT
jgi:hypothetical protein